MTEPVETVSDEPEVEEEEEDFDHEKVQELVASLKADDLIPVIQEAGAKKLAAIKEAEEAGKERKSVLEAVSVREAELEEEGETPEQLPELPDFEEAPVEELLPIIGVGFWVRVASGKGIPPEVVGRDAVVTFAPVRESQGQDTISEPPYQYQDGSEVFTVRLRDTGGLFQLTRDNFLAFAPEQAQLLALVHG
jgi:hypothetical protein